MTAPSAPLNVAASNTSSTSVRVTWDRPDTPRGIIRNYTVSYRQTDSSVSMSSSTGDESREIELTGLDIYTNYTITVTAETVSPGDPSDPVTVFTDEDGKRLQSDFHKFNAIVQVMHVHTCTSIHN